MIVHREQPTAIVVGGAGFIGSHFVDAWIERGRVVVLDDFSNGKRAFLESAESSGRLDVVEGDARDLAAVESAIAKASTPVEVVVHLAANPEARHGLANTRLDLELGTITTYNVLEGMRRAGLKRLLFASSGTVYGDVAAVCTEGDLGALPISLYGASKLAAEAMISAFCECFDLVATIYRFGNVVGPRGTHGAALDFLKKLQATPTRLEVLGDGRQSKPYLHVDDCVAGLLFGLGLSDSRDAEERLSVFNLAPPDTTSVRRIAELCRAASPYPNATIDYTGGDRGWRGDVPQSRLSPQRLKARGFAVSMSSDEAVSRAITALAEEVFGASETANG